MAKAPAKQETPAAAVAPKKNKKWLIIIIAVVFLVLVLAGGVAFLLLKKSHGGGENPAGESAGKSSKSEAQPVFVRLEAFTVGLQPDPEKQGQYLQTVPELKVRDITVDEKLKGYMPEIRYKIILLLQSKKPSDLSTPQGVEKLSFELRNQINQILSGGVKPVAAGEAAANAGPNDPVQAVVFSSFIIQ